MGANPRRRRIRRQESSSKAMTPHELKMQVYSNIKSKPCLSCHTRLRIEAAHIQPPSSKLRNQWANRSHGGEAGFYCIPLCADCHRGKGGIHEATEGDWLELRIQGGRAMAYAVALQNLLEVIYSQHTEDNSDEALKAERLFD